MESATQPGPLDRNLIAQEHRNRIQVDERTVPQSWTGGPRHARVPHSAPEPARSMTPLVMPGINPRPLASAAQVGRNPPGREESLVATYLLEMAIPEWSGDLANRQTPGRPPRDVLRTLPGPSVYDRDSTRIPVGREPWSRPPSIPLESGLDGCTKTLEP